MPRVVWWFNGGSPFLMSEGHIQHNMDACGMLCTRKSQMEEQAAVRARASVQNAQPCIENASRCFRLPGGVPSYLAHEKQPPLLGPPKGPRQGPRGALSLMSEVPLCRLEA